MEKAFFRNAIASVVALTVLAGSQEKFSIQKSSLPDLFKRSVFGTIGLCFNFWAVDHIGLADANILNKMPPFFAMFFSVRILRKVPGAFEVVTLLAIISMAVLRWGYTVRQSREP